MKITAATTNPVVNNAAASGRAVSAIARLPRTTQSLPVGALAFVPFEQPAVSERLLSGFAAVAKKQGPIAAVQWLAKHSGSLAALVKTPVGRAALASAVLGFTAGWEAASKASRVQALATALKAVSDQRLPADQTAQQVGQVLQATLAGDKTTKQTQRNGAGADWPVARQPDSLAQAQTKLARAKRVLAESQAVLKQNPLNPGQREIVQARQASVAKLQGQVEALKRAEMSPARKPVPASVQTGVQKTTTTPPVRTPARTPTDAVVELGRGALQDSQRAGNSTGSARGDARADSTGRITQPESKPQARRQTASRPGQTPTQVIAATQKTQPRTDEVGRPVDSKGQPLPGGTSAPSPKPMPMTPLPPSAQKTFDQAAAKSKARVLEQREAAYAAGRISREEAMAGLSGDDATRMAKRLNDVDARRGVKDVGNGGSYRGAADAAKTKAALEDVDKRGGVAALSEARVRTLTGQVESALKQGGLPEQDAAYLKQRLKDLQSKQTYIHEGRAVLSDDAQAASSASASGGAQHKWATAAATSSGRLHQAIRVRNTLNSARAIADVPRYLAYLKLLHGQPFQTIIRVGITGTQYGEESLTQRTRHYRNAGIGNLHPQTSSSAPHMFDEGTVRHEVHSAFGAVSKFGEINAASKAMSTGSKQTWAERGLLPGQTGMPVKGFWKADFDFEWTGAETALALLQKIQPKTKTKFFTESVLEPLRSAGFIPQGSQLAARLEILERRYERRDALQAQMSTAATAETPALQAKVAQAQQDIAAALSDARKNATKIAGQLLEEGLGNPQTTYELTVRHAAAARYVQSIEGQRDAVFDYAKFESILKQVQAEAGDPAQAGLRWHREIVNVHEGNAKFKEAMAQRPEMANAWAAYKKKFGR
jgi:hypothetical protein